MLSDKFHENDLQTRLSKVEVTQALLRGKACKETTGKVSQDHGETMYWNGSHITLICKLL